MTIAELITMTDLLYPNVESTQNKVVFMNQAQRILNPYFAQIRQYYDTTTADTDIVPFPEGVTDVSQIISLGISKTVDDPADRYDYQLYQNATMLDYPQEGYGYYQNVDEEGTKTLIVYPAPSQTGLILSVTYKKPLTALLYTTTTQVPDFDPNFHDMLAFYCAHMLAMKGSAPDTMQADAFMQKWESGMRELYKRDMHDKITHPKRRRDNAQWHGAKQHVGYIPGTPV